MELTIRYPMKNRFSWAIEGTEKLIQILLWMVSTSIIGSPADWKVNSRIIPTNRAVSTLIFTLSVRKDLLKS